MKRRKSLIILAAVIVVLCAVIIIEQAVTRHVDSINTTDEVILTIDQDSLTTVSWTYEEETLTFDRTDGEWSDSEDADFPVDQDAMEDFLSWFEEVHACFIIDDVEDYSQYGLEEPQCTVTLTTEDGETVVSVGNYSAMDEQRYIEIGDGKVYLVEDDILEDITTDRDEFMKNDETPSIITLDTLTAQGEAQLNAVYDEEGKYSYTDSYNYYQVEDDGTYLVLDDSLVESYLSTLANLSLTDYVTYTASSADLSEYGLDEPAYTITVTGTVEVEAREEETEEETTEETETEAEAEEAETEDVEFVIYIGVITEEAEEDGEEDTVTAYVRVGDSEIIYLLDESDYEDLTAVTYDDLRPTTVLSLDWDKVAGISFTISDETCEVDVMSAEEYAQAYGTEDDEDSSSDDDEEVYYYLIDGQEIEFESVMDTVDELTVDSFTDEDSTDTLEMSMAFTLSDEDYPSVEIEIYQYDSESCLLVQDGETVGFISRSQMVDLREELTTIWLGLEQES